MFCTTNERRVSSRDASRSAKQSRTVASRTAISSSSMRSADRFPASRRRAPGMDRGRIFRWWSRGTTVRVSYASRWRASQNGGRSSSIPRTKRACGSTPPTELRPLGSVTRSRTTAHAAKSCSSEVSATKATSLATRGFGTARFGRPAAPRGRRRATTIRSRTTLPAPKLSSSAGSLLPGSPTPGRGTVSRGGNGRPTRRRRARTTVSRTTPPAKKSYCSVVSTTQMIRSPTRGRGTARVGPCASRPAARWHAGRSRSCTTPLVHRRCCSAAPPTSQRSTTTHGFGMVVAGR